MPVYFIACTIEDFDLIDFFTVIFAFIFVHFFGMRSFSCGLNYKPYVMTFELLISNLESHF